MLLQIKQNRYLLKMNCKKYQKKVEEISTKGLTKDLINEYKILNSVKYFFQEYSKII